mgnify:CR=1 FL=1
MITAALERWLAPAVLVLLGTTGCVWESTHSFTNCAQVEQYCYTSCATYCDWYGCWNECFPVCESVCVAGTQPSQPCYLDRDCARGEYCNSRGQCVRDQGPGPGGDAGLCEPCLTHSDCGERGALCLHVEREHVHHRHLLRGRRERPRALRQLERTPPGLVKGGVQAHHRRQARVGQRGHVRVHVHQPVLDRHDRLELPDAGGGHLKTPGAIACQPQRDRPGLALGQAHHGAGQERLDPELTATQVHLDDRMRETQRKPERVGVRCHLELDRDRFLVQHTRRAQVERREAAVHGSGGSGERVDGARSGDGVDDGDEREQ